jgi:hypothetical protein
VVVARETGDVTLDQQKFKQALFNLLSNAIKFNHDGGAVGDSVEPCDRDCVKLVISDKCCRYPCGHLLAVLHGGSVKAQEQSEDLELIHRSQAGDTGAFDELVTKYRASVYTMILGGSQ